MNSSINAQSDSVIAILVEQCQDLERLLLLARQETLALRTNDFDQLLDIVKERAVLTSRLEVYHQQLAELRGLIKGSEPATPSEIVTKTQALVMELNLQYSESKPLLLAAREKLLQDTRQLEQVRRGVNGYSQNSYPTSVAYDQHL